MPYIYFWLDCFWRGATFGGGVFSAIEIICALLWCFYRRKGDDEFSKDKREEKVRTIGKWCFIAALVFSTVFVAPFLKFQEADNQKTTQEKLDYIEQNRPVLEPRLVIDSVKSNSVAYHFEVQNTGKIAASSISEEQKSQSFTLPEFKVHNRYLAPNATMSIISDDALVSGYFQLDLFLKYSAEYQDTNKIYNAKFDFFIPAETLKNGEFHYQEGVPDLTVDPVHGTNSQVGLFDKALEEMPVGTIAFWLQYNPTNRAFVGTKKQLLIVDELLNTVLFKSTSENGKPFAVAHDILTNKYGWNRIVCSWSTNYIQLAVDGDTASQNYDNKSVTNIVDNPR